MTQGSRRDTVWIEEVYRMVMAHRKGPAPAHTDDEYLAFDPGAADDFPAEVEARKTKLVTTRKEHTCFGWKGDMQHPIPAGTRAFRESGKCEGHFGTSYMCLPCVDICLEPEWW